MLPQLEQDMVHAKAFVSEDSGRSFVHYRVSVRFSRPSGEAYREGEWNRILPHPESTGWLTISRANKEIEVVCV